MFRGLGFMVYGLGVQNLGVAEPIGLVLGCMV